MNGPQGKPPLVPSLVGRPLSLLPKRPARMPAEYVLNHLFARQLRDGDLGFLEDRIVTVCIDDIGLRFSLTLQGDRIRVLRTTCEGDLQISGPAYSFLQLTTRTEDSDTLFFRRHLSTSGDTELGLYVKNLLDSIDLEEMPLQPALGYGLRLTLRAADSIEAVRTRLSGL